MTAQPPRWRLALVSRLLIPPTPGWLGAVLQGATGGETTTMMSLVGLSCPPPPCRLGTPMPTRTTTLTMGIGVRLTRNMYGGMGDGRSLAFARGLEALRIEEQCVLHGPAHTGATKGAQGCYEEDQDGPLLLDGRLGSERLAVGSSFVSAAGGPGHWVCKPLGGGCWAPRVSGPQ